MILLRILIPSWRFFDRLGRVPELLYRVKNNGEWGNWGTCFERPQRKLWHLFSNPHGNMYLAYRSLVDRLIDDSQKTQDLEKEISFQLIKNLVHQTILKNKTSKTTHYAFKIKVTYFDTTPSTSTDIFVTHEYEV